MMILDLRVDLQLTFGPQKVRLGLLGCNNLIERHETTQTGYFVARRR